jgi:hypothetical protein
VSVTEHPPMSAQPPISTPSTIDAVRRRRFSVSLIMRVMEPLLLLAMLGLLAHNRLELGRQFLFAYSDEDQTLMWHAANDLLHGNIPEPCFYGQSFNTCLEGYLAIPLILLHVPYWVAVPSVTIVLGLLPFLLIAWLAWWHGRPGLAALSLAIPLVLPVRYAMETGMPRGFITGIALAIVPCLLLAKATPVPTFKPRARWRTPFRYFLIGLLSVAALTINPNCGLLLAGALGYAVATRWREAAFWLYASLGAFVGALYPLFIFLFYYKLHDDYRLYHRDYQLDWNLYNVRWSLNNLKPSLGDFLPLGAPLSATAWVVAGCFAAILIYLLVTRRWSAVFATVAAVAFAVFSFGFKRVHEGNASVFFAYSRMYLAVPVVPVLLLLWGTVRKGPASPWCSQAWISRGCLVVLLGVSLYASRQKNQVMPAIVAQELNRVELLQLIDVQEAHDVAQAVQSAAVAQKSDFVLLVGNQKRWAYLLPVLTNCQTLYPSYERRTWRLYEESFPKHNRILVMDRPLFDRAASRFPHATVVSQNPFIAAFDTNGASVVRICQELSTNVRPFKAPHGSDAVR